MRRIGITGQSGFIGSQLYNKLHLLKERFTVVDFCDSFYEKDNMLQKFVRDCDIIIHLAAMNRHKDQNFLYETNILLTEKLISACNAENVCPHIFFSSSIQEEADNEYGRSKKAGRKLLENWAKVNNASFTVLIIPNVYGPYGKPFYNSVVATFCYQLANNERPHIEVDKTLNLIYVDELIDFIINNIEKSSLEKVIETLYVPASMSVKVSEILTKLMMYKDNYFRNGSIPDLSSSFERNLFNTFLTYIDHKSFFPCHLKLNSDERGVFVEVIKLCSGGQVSFSTTRPGIVRGNHFHTRKTERFAVIKGKALIEIRQIGKKEKLSFEMDGDHPSFVDMPVWFTHNIKNIGSDDVYTIFWISEKFNAGDPDTYFEEV